MDIVWDDEIKKDETKVIISPTIEKETPKQVVESMDIVWDDEIRDKKTGEIMTPQTFKKEETARNFESGKTLGNVGQFVGGIGGGIAGGVVGHPYVGAAVGGTAGKLAGRLTTEQIKQAKESQGLPGIVASGLPLGPLGFPLTLAKMKPEEREKLGKETVKTAVVETVLAPLGVGLNYAGKGILRGLLGARVAERGFERGFGKILNPEFNQGRVPKTIAEKTSKFFNRLSNTTGKAIDDLLQSPDLKNSVTDVSTLKENVRGLMPEGYTDISKYIDDILLPTVSNSERNLLKQEAKKVLSMGGTKRRVLTLWNQRKTLDKMINSKNWSEEGVSFLNSLRKILNDPIKKSDPRVAEAFTKYRFVKAGEYDLGKNFAAVKGPGDEIYASPAERFAAELMSTKKDDLMRRLKDLDKLANADDKIIDDFIDYAASEALDKKIGMGVFQEILVGMLGGRKSVARIGQFGQQPIIRALEKGVGRGTAVGISNLLDSEE